MANSTDNMKPNCWKGVKYMGINSSPGKDRHVQHVSADHHPVTASINSVKGMKFLGTYLLPGKERHEWQVSLDRYLATACIKHKIPHGAWNVWTLNNCSQIDNVKQEMSRLKINILGICETKWPNNRDFVSNENRVIYAGGEKNDKGVGLILDKTFKEYVLGYYQLSERILVVKLKRKSFNTSIIIVYTPAA